LAGRLDRLRRRFARFGLDVLTCDEQIHCAPVEWALPRNMASWPRRDHGRCGACEFAHDGTRRLHGHGGHMCAGGMFAPR
jgi:hypothetical protein